MQRAPSFRWDGVKIHETAGNSSDEILLREIWRAGAPIPKAQAPIIRFAEVAQDKNQDSGMTKLLALEHRQSAPHWVE